MRQVPLSIEIDTYFIEGTDSIATSIATVAFIGPQILYRTEPEPAETGYRFQQQKARHEQECVNVIEHRLAVLLSTNPGGDPLAQQHIGRGE